MIVIPNMDKPKSCDECWSGLAIAINCEAGTGFHNPDGDLIPPDCPLIEIDEEGIQKAKECLTVIKAMWRLFKIKVNESEELKQELWGMDSNLTIIDESYGERRSDE